ncbi:MAG: 1,4-alpha-glucan branching protein domain-containing protein [Myxococcota bacterium]
MSGSFCLVLHGHLPWVLHHGRWPHGEDWLFEAVSETWLPMIELLDQCREEGLLPRFTIGLTPILLEQLASPRLREGLPPWLEEQAERGRRDRAEFESEGQGHMAWLATRWTERFERLLARFEQADRDIIGEMRRASDEGLIELLTSNATHGYHPLLTHDACGRAQVRAGVATSNRHLGKAPRGMWLPECAYRPPRGFWPPAIHGDERWAQGTGSMVAAEGIRYFVVDSHLLHHATPQAVLVGQRAQAVGPEQAGWDHLRGWNHVLQPHRLVEQERLLDVSVFARSPSVSEQVWSGAVGYPGDGRYLEFHKRRGPRGLQYWKITGPNRDLGDKDLYYPDDIGSVTHAQAQHFAALIRDQLGGFEYHSGRPGVVTAPFDAELFGHWWHEGLDFLLEVVRAIHHDPSIETATLGQVLEQDPPDKAVSLPEGSWGEEGDHRVWQNDELHFYWQVEVRAEDRFMDLWHRAPWRDVEPVRELLEEAGRQLLLLQASDWPFVISTGGAVDYGLRRIFHHASLFDDLCNGVEDRIAHPERAADPVVEAALQTSRLRDAVFPDLELAWWS